MKSFAYYSVECPVCRSPINSVAPLSGETLCPFCGAVCHITANLTEKAEMPERIAPFSTSFDEFRQTAMSMLVAEDYAPVNISGLVPFEGAKGVYLPVYLYEGQYECTWSCKMKAEGESAGNRKEVYRPQNGVSKGGYTITCMACDGVASAKELAEYVRSLDAMDVDIQSFHTDILHGRFFLTHNRNSQTSWKQWGEDTLSDLVGKKTQMQMQSNEMKDFKCNLISETLPESRLMFFPVWMIHFQYDGESHHIFMDGTGRNGIKGTTLIDHTLKATAEKPFKSLKYIAVAAIVIPVLMFMAGWPLPAIIALIASALVFFGYRYYARWHKGRVIRKARKQRKKILFSNP